MVARIWHGRTPAAKADAYLTYLEATGLHEYRATPGNRGVRVLRRIDGEQAEFLLISLWDDKAAIRAFAGDDMERAVYYPEDDAYLFYKEPTVSHYEIVFEDGE